MEAQEKIRNEIVDDFVECTSVYSGELDRNRLIDILINTYVITYKSQEAIDYKSLLQKYMKSVINAEGVSFVYECIAAENFTIQEKVALQEMEAHLYKASDF